MRISISTVPASSCGTAAAPPNSAAPPCEEDAWLTGMGGGACSAPHSRPHEHTRAVRPAWHHERTGKRRASIGAHGAAVRPADCWPTLRGVLPQPVPVRKRLPAPGLAHACACTCTCRRISHHPRVEVAQEVCLHLSAHGGAQRVLRGQLQQAAGGHVLCGAGAALRVRGKAAGVGVGVGQSPECGRVWAFAHMWVRTCVRTVVRGCVMGV